ncbi:MAG TPA: aminodeoxychorismate synthase component I [Solirubrobacterales bacterium]|nr:aminodeoxychorismate synthase component I [Solirubrobacterales bacterium]
MLLARRLDLLPDPENAFVHLYGASPDAFWLDGSATGERGRFSFLGDAGGPLGAVVAYDVKRGEVSLSRGGRVEIRDESIFDFLAWQTAEWGASLGSARVEGIDELPFDFECGFAGYLGYELKAECGGLPAHRASTPDAAFVLADRLIAFDHQENQTYLLALTASTEVHQLVHPAGVEVDAVGAGEAWIEETGQRLAELPAPAEPVVGRSPSFALQRSQERYRDDVEACRRYLTAGDSYEICLTNRAETKGAMEPLDLYRMLRRANPAPFSAYLRFGELAVLSSSPERFLAVDRDGWAETRPIKGTSRRGETTEEDARLAAQLGVGAKYRAENVTIVDLMRNDLGRVCAVGSVGVPELMRVETYETLHQLVSSVRGRLRPDVSAPEAVRACFPPGSMTGAPKLRTMEIIDELEGAARGVYSGAVGWFGLGGTCDLSVAIRTIVLDGERISVGAGGAVVLDSDPEDEFEEMLLKARAPLSAFGSTADILPLPT